MSTPEYPIKDYGDGTAGTYLSKCATCGTVFIGHKRDVWCGCTRPAASVEAGQPSALRASAPEGTDPLTAAYRARDDAWDEIERLRAALTELVATVKGECPSILNEDSGGSAVLIGLVIDALSSPGQSQGRGSGEAKL